MRSILAVVGVFCIATVLAEAAGLALLWQRGQLTRDTLKDVRLALSGTLHDNDRQQYEESPTRASAEEIVRKRTLRILDLSTREDEASKLKDMLNAKADGLIASQMEFEKKQEAFQKQLQELKDRETAEATEQARGILLALSPENAVQFLMGLSAEENIALLKGMPEKSIARIEEEFLNDQAGQKSERGQQIFAALSRGLPVTGAIDEALENDP